MFGWNWYKAILSIEFSIVAFCDAVKVFLQSTHSNASLVLNVNCDFSTRKKSIRIACSHWNHEFLSLEIHSISFRRLVHKFVHSLFSFILHCTTKIKTHDFYRCLSNEQLWAYIWLYFINLYVAEITYKALFLHFQQIVFVLEQCEKYDDAKENQTSFASNSNVGIWQSTY